MTKVGTQFDVRPTARVLVSAMKTPDGTILRSRHRHEFVTHIDKNGKYYMLDGGLDYCRCTVNGDEDFIVLTDEDAFEDVRLVFGRFSRGKMLDEKPRYVPLCDMTDDHLKAVIEYCETTRGAGTYLDLYKRELEYRTENSISVPEK